jgi:hypothetical protein
MLWAGGELFFDHMKRNTTYFILRSVSRQRLQTRITIVMDSSFRDILTRKQLRIWAVRFLISSYFPIICLCAVWLPLTKLRLIKARDERLAIMISESSYDDQNDRLLDDTDLKSTPEISTRKSL